MRHLILTLTLFITCCQLHAGQPTFPWHSSPPMGSVPVRVLTPPATSPIERLPPKQAYPYGWFGPKPTAQWQRSFGSSKNFTQWSRR